MKRKAQEIDIPRLCQAMQRSRLALRRPREIMRDIAKQVAGDNWSEEGARRPVIINLLSIYQGIIGRTLIPHNPRLMLSTFQRLMKPSVSATQKWSNRQLQHIRFDETMRRVVTNALYSVGFAKVAIASPADSAHAAWNLRAGEVNVWDIDLDDIVFDLHAKKWSEVSYMGHRIRLPLDVIKDSRYYDKARKYLEPTYDPMFNAEGGDERISMLGRTYLEGDGPEFQDMVDLWEIYLPRHRLVVTLADSQVTGVYSPNLREKGALRIQQWIGPPRGPYHVLGYGVVPGNLMPKGPMQDLFNLHSATNNAMRKLIRTVHDLKEITMVRQGADADGNNVIEADDGQMIGVADPSSVTQVVMGGQHAQLLLAMATSFKDLFSFVGGNIELLGGRGAQSRTATQDKLLDENANAGVADLQETTTDYVADVCRSLVWYFWHDPKTVMKVKHALPGLPEMETTLRVHPAGAVNHRTGQPQRLQRLGPLPDMEVDPYSLQHQTPQARFGQLTQLVQNVMMPMMNLMVQQGKTIDLDFLLRKCAEYLNQPDLGELVNITEPPEQTAGQGQGGGEQPSMPANTNREYTRHNVSETTPGQRDQNQIAAMLGHGLGGDNRPGANGKPQMMGAR